MNQDLKSDHLKKEKKRTRLRSFPVRYKFISSITVILYMELQHNCDITAVNSRLDDMQLYKSLFLTVQQWHWSNFTG